MTMTKTTTAAGGKSDGGKGEGSATTMTPTTTEKTTTKKTTTTTTTTNDACRVCLNDGGSKWCEHPSDRGKSYCQKLGMSCKKGDWKKIKDAAKCPPTTDEEQHKAVADEEVQM